MVADSGSRLPSLLVVDDEERILSALRRTLRREGYEIVTSESVYDALRILGERPIDGAAGGYYRFVSELSRSIDLILSDQKMPGMSGLQFLTEATKRCPGAVRMLITGWTEEIPPQKLEELGIFALINKPWDDAQLKETLRRASVRTS